MIAKGFKPVGWVAGVATAALGCYMLSLQVASERAELESLQRRIVAARQDIRSLQTELGTRGRMTQLERWNAEVLALSAPTANQYLDNEMRLARFDVHAPTVADTTADVRMASAPAAPATAATPAAPVRMASAERPAAAERREEMPVAPKVSQARTEVAAEPVPQVRRAAAPARGSELLGDDALRAIGAAARSEGGGR